MRDAVKGFFVLTGWLMVMGSWIVVGVQSCTPEEQTRPPIDLFAQEVGDDTIRGILIRESIAGYSGSCPCPYYEDSAGRRCGGRSAYSRPGGESPLCYPEDVSDARVALYRAQNAPPAPEAP